jgi:hypothetical protein
MTLRLFILTCIVFLGLKSQGQNAIIKIDKLSKYELYIIDVSLQEIIPDTINAKELSVRWDTLNSFVVYDTNEIIRISNEWKGEKTSEMFNCGYNYIIYVIRDSQVVDEIQVNEICKQAVSSDGIFNFKAVPINKDSFRNEIHVAHLSFKELEIARRFLSDLKELNGYYTNPIHYWDEYDGKFIIKYPKGDSKIALMELNKILKEKFPNDKLDIRLFGERRDFTLIQIRCRENFYKTFDLFTTYSDWQTTPSVGVTIFGKETNSLNELIAKYSR